MKPTYVCSPSAPPSSKSIFTSPAPVLTELALLGMLFIPQLTHTDGSVRTFVTALFILLMACDALYIDHNINFVVVHHDNIC